MQFSNLFHFPMLQTLQASVVLYALNDWIFWPIVMGCGMLSAHAQNIE